ncbi:MAG: M18 family aminopeptidase [Alistipes sp.]|nr:M18 family aminopeptidase [Alistipes sp.]
MIQEYLRYAKEATCPFCAVRAAEEYLKNAGFSRLDLLEDWKLERGKGYFVNIYGSSLAAFYVGEEFTGSGRLTIAAAHSDQPCFVIKPNAVMNVGKYRKLNVESYGGAILNTWLDRPLGISGIVVTKGADSFHPNVRVVDFKKPMLVIPNLAIHFNRDVNKGVELNKQKDMLPLMGMMEDYISGEMEDRDYLLRLLAEETGADMDDILDYQLYLYNYEEGMTVGAAKDILLAPRIDNLASVFAGLKAVVSQHNDTGLNMTVVFDNEEVGSRTKQGAGANLLRDILERIYGAFRITGEAFQRSVCGGFFLSVDGAHAVHPNQTEKYDPTNPVYLNDGIVIKRAAGQTYATDASAAGIIKEICGKNNIAYKEFVNKSDSVGGSTLGAVASTMLPMRMADVGVPMLAMHSAMETAGVKDLEALVRLIGSIFKEL